MFFGAHVSIAGGLENAPDNAAAIGCEVFQIFTRSPQGGLAAKITPQVINSFSARCAQRNLKEWVIHAPYYINFASDLPHIRASSAHAVREEMERSTLIRAAYVMFHPGSSREVGEAEGVRRCIEGIKKSLNGYSGSTKPLLEISAGAGAIIGDRFEEVAAILDGVGNPELGVCFDTAHAFASGYDLRDAKAVEKTLHEFDKTIGLKRLKVVHCNDSKIELGGHRDLHEHLGAGLIGLDGFRALIQDTRLTSVNFYCETEGNGVAHDIQLLKKLRGKVK